MIKTITDLQPLIYASMFEQAEKRRIQRHQLLLVLRWILLPVLYLGICMKITFDTGIPPWNWRFLLMFVPVFLVGEQAFFDLWRRWARG
jgi:hypothetical protein